jgi:hypothetical protein
VDAGASKSGKGTYTAIIENVFPLDLSVFQGACPGQGDWTVVAVVIQDFEGHITVFDAEGDIATQVTATCSIPPEFRDKIPDPGTEYVCIVKSLHVS